MSGSALRHQARARAHQVPHLVRTVPQVQPGSRTSTAHRRRLGPTIPRLPKGDITTADFNWLRPPVADRSWQYLLHSWDFFVPWLESYVEASDGQERREKDVRFCLDGALSWWDQVESAPLGGEGMAWYDMSLSSRAPLLALLILIASDRDDVDDRQFEALLRCARAHQEVFARAEIFNPSTNHGLFLSISQTSFATILDFMDGMGATGRLGQERLRVMVSTQYLKDGGHSEHSPLYHHAMLGVFESALESGLIDDEQVRTWVRKAAAALGGMVQPDGSLVALGDTRAMDISKQHVRSRDPHTDWVISKGQRGAPPSDRVTMLPDAGYVFVRSPGIKTFQDFRASSYLAIQAGFHSRAHKHADDLSFVWWVGGEQVLVDPGRYMYGDNLPADSPLRVEGYYYADPYRQYVESTRAHSTVEVDDTIQRRRRAPYGSAVQAVEQTDNLIVIRCRAPQQGYVHERTWEMGTDDSLVVTDHVASQDGKKHTLRQWWQVHGKIGLVPADNSLDLLLPSGRRVAMEQDEQLADLQIGRGLTQPWRGHASPQDRMREPAWSCDWSAEFASSITVRTRFTAVP